MKRIIRESIKGDSLATLNFHSSNDGLVSIDHAYHAHHNMK